MILSGPMSPKTLSGEGRSFSSSKSPDTAFIVGQSLSSNRWAMERHGFSRRALEGLLERAVAIST